MKPIGRSVQPSSITNASLSEFGDEEAPDLESSSEHHHHHHHHHHKHNNSNHHEEDDSPQYLVRADDRAVRFFRCLVLCVLLVAALLTASVIYVYVDNAEKRAFRNDFNSIGEEIVQALQSDMTRKLFMTNTVAATISSVMRATEANPWNLFVPGFDAISDEIRYVGEAILLAWSPYLATRTELETFQEYAAQHQGGATAYDPCYFCQTPLHGFLNPYELMTIDGFGSRSCGFLEEMGRVGSLSSDGCLAASFLVEDFCVCSDEPITTEAVLDRVSETAAVATDVEATVFRIQDGKHVEETGEGPFVPFWQLEVNGQQNPVFWNQMSDPSRERAISAMMESGVAVFTEMAIREGDYYDTYAALLGAAGSVMFYPVRDGGGDIVGVVTAEIGWRFFSTDVFPRRSQFLDIVIENTCGPAFTFNVNITSQNLVLKGKGDLHDPSFDHMVHRSTYEQFEKIVQLVTPSSKPHSQLDYCRYRFSVYATGALEDQFRTEEPRQYAVFVFAIFVFTGFVFLIYDFLVVRRQRKVMASATKTAALVSTLFPKTVRSRLMQQESATSGSGGGGGGGTSKKQLSPRRGSLLSTRARLRRFLADSPEPQEMSAAASAPIADLFPNCTVFFLDLAGFTSWSSERTPADVFVLLETLYNAFDTIAKKMGVFKVETIGDSYVAVTGLPHPRNDHAVVMVKFAYACIKTMSKLTKELVTSLGPSTAELKARCGLHSGPVTAGVLRGDKARFQLFGDTVNTASRMESLGVPERIQASKQTVDLLLAAGKEHWVVPREGMIVVKGKGQLQTYWVNPARRRHTAIRTTPTIVSGDFSNAAEEFSDNVDDLILTDSVHQPNKLSSAQRLIEWNVELLYALLTKLIASRKSTGWEQEPRLPIKDGTVIDEVVDGIAFPPLDECHDRESPEALSVNPDVKAQLRDYVQQIASLYRDGNFERASHATLASSKFMEQICAPPGIDDMQGFVNDADRDESLAQRMHERTFDLGSDLLTHFAVVFSSLIHDVDHPGLPNDQLVKMNTSAAAKYGSTSIAEQNSVDVAWGVLMDDRFRLLRQYIFQTEEELKRFRQVLVNTVMATDIMDKELVAARNKRWDAALSDPSVSDAAINRKATVVVEYIVQTSAIVHTMQHWHTYLKWNQRLFFETYAAWESGVIDADPSLVWYKGELMLFDYVIPLAERFEECGVFGAAFHESLLYAKENRNEWERKGEALVEDMVSQWKSMNRRKEPEKEHVVQGREEQEMQAANAIGEYASS